MPAKGTHKLTARQKAKIAAEKRTGISTLKNIAASNGVCESTVQKAAKSTDPEVLALIPGFVEEALIQAQHNFRDAGKKVNELIHSDNVSLHEATGAWKTAFDIAERASGRPTAIIEIRTLEFKVHEFIRLMIEGGVSVEQTLQLAKTAPLTGVPDEIRERVVEAQEKALMG